MLRILWLLPVTSHFAPLWAPLPLLGIYSHLPSSLASAERLTPAHLRVHMCVAYPVTAVQGYMPMLCAPVGAVLAASV